MQCSEFLDTIESQLVDQIERGRIAGHKVTVEHLNSKPAQDSWSMAQIYEHMMLGDAPYLSLIKSGIESAKAGGGQIKHTFIGKLIMKGAGPSGNVPPSKPMIPGPGPYTPDIVDRWAAQTQSIIDLAKAAKGHDICSLRVRNPFIRLLRMNLADAFRIITEHTERHVQQLELLTDRPAAVHIH